MRFPVALSLAWNYSFMGVLRSSDFSFCLIFGSCEVANFAEHVSERNFMRNLILMKARCSFSVQHYGSIIRFPVALRLHGMTVAWVVYAVK